MQNKSKRSIRETLYSYSYYLLDTSKSGFQFEISEFLLLWQFYNVFCISFSIYFKKKNKTIKFCYAFFVFLLLYFKVHPKSNKVCAINQTRKHILFVIKWSCIKQFNIRFNRQTQSFIVVVTRYILVILNSMLPDRHI